MAAIGVALLASGVPAVAATFTVNSRADAGDINPGDGTCGALLTSPGFLVCTLRAAVQEVNALAGVHTINVPGGLYVLTKGELDVRSNVTINGPSPRRGPGLSLAATIDGDYRSRVFDIAEGFIVNLNRLTIRRGRACQGAGIRNAGALTISRSVIRDNALTTVAIGEACNGGGIQNTINGIVTIETSTIRRNTGSNEAFGGGVSNAGGVAIFDSTIRDNHVSGSGFETNGGGGIKSTDVLVLSNSTVRDNSSTIRGGGLWLTGVSSLSTSTVTGNTSTAFDDPFATGGIHNQGLLEIARSTISNNRGGTAGSISYERQGEVSGLTMTNTTVSQNQARGLTDFVVTGGVALSVPKDAGPVSIVNSTISHNAIPSNAFFSFSAGGLQHLSSGPVELRNTIVANNAVQDCDSSAHTMSLGHNLASDLSCNFTAAGDMVDTDPQLGPLADNGGPTQTRRLNVGSPAIDAGDDVGCPAIDQRGVTRPQGAACDIGAYEARPFIFTMPGDLSMSVHADSGAVPAGRTLTYHIVVSNREQSPASGVTLVDRVPRGAAVVSARPSQGRCDTRALRDPGSAVVCKLGDLAVGAQAEVEIVVSPSKPGIATNTAIVTGDLVDSNARDNVATTMTRVSPASTASPSRPGE